jgi:hypothetical protein
MKYTTIDGVRWMVLDIYTDKSEAIEARDDWKHHLRTQKPNAIVRIAETKDGNGLKIWEVLARQEG